MINKEMFCKAIEVIREYEEYVDTVEEASKGCIRLWDNDAISNLENFIIDAIAMGSQEKVEVIEWYLFERNLGRDVENSWFDEEGKAIDISTPELFYEEVKKCI